MASKQQFIEFNDGQFLNISEISEVKTMTDEDRLDTYYVRITMKNGREHVEKYRSADAMAREMDRVLSYFDVMPKNV
jgi:hypothetical protein